MSTGRAFHGKENFHSTGIRFESSERFFARWNPFAWLPIGGRPIVWHIMKGLAVHGIKELVLCLGYKDWLIHEEPGGGAESAEVPSQRALDG